MDYKINEAQQANVGTLEKLDIWYKNKQDTPRAKRKKNKKTKPKSHHTLLPSESFLTGKRRNNFYINNNHDWVRDLLRGMLEQFQLPEDCLCNNFQKQNKNPHKNINNMEASYNQKYDYKKTKTNKN